MVALPFDVAEVRQGLGMAGVESQLAFELRTSFVIPLRLPMEIAEAEMNVGFAGSNLRGGLEFGDGFGGSTEAVKGFADLLPAK